MDPRLLKYYNRELNFIREMGGEFAKEYPKIAGRLRLEGIDCADPYVERLLEGFAFLAARVQLKIDSEFPRFTQHLLEMVYPQYLAPIPSATMVKFDPDLKEGSLVEGFTLPRGSAMRGKMLSDELTPCDFRTAHDLTLWPLKLVDAEYFVNVGDFAGITTVDGRKAAAAIRLRIETTAGGGMNDLALDRLELFLSGPDSLPMRIYELCLANSVAVVVQPAERPAPWHDVIDRSSIQRVGFEDEESLLPYGPRSFHGYRLLQEYFMLPERFMFLAIDGLSRAVRRCVGNQLDIIILLSEAEPSLKTAIDASLFNLFVTPATNIFPKRSDRIHLTDQAEEFQVIPDRTRPLDFEIYRIDGLTGYGSQNERERQFEPFYKLGREHNTEEGNAYYTLHRTPRQLPARMQGRESRSAYTGSEVYVSLVDSAESVVSTSLKQLGVQTLCTNRDLPLFMQTGKGSTDFTLESGAPVNAIRCLVGPTRPRPSYPEGETIWRLISHLNLNYLSVVDKDEDVGAEALRELLTLYGNASDPTVRKQIDGVRSIKSNSVTRLLTGDGPSTFGRGIELTLEFDENAFEGSGVFLLGAVLERFFSKYSSINSFAETVVRTVDRGEIIRWPIRLGRRHVL
jgi:type VI secretion system protein ImpG